MPTTRRYVSSSFNLALPRWLAACLHTGQAHYKQNDMCRDRMCESQSKWKTDSIIAMNFFPPLSLLLSSISFRFIWFQFRSIYQCFPFSISCSEFIRFVFNIAPHHRVYAHIRFVRVIKFELIGNWSSAFVCFRFSDRRFHRLAVGCNWCQDEHFILLPETSK